MNVVFLGYELSSEGKGLEPDFFQKCSAVKTPNTLRQLQTQLGFLNFGRAYFLHYAEQVKPLYGVMVPTFSRKHWTEKHTNIMRAHQTDKLESKYLQTRDNKKN